jgi:glycine oxidase
VRVAVVGGGIIGSAVAYELASRGATVTVFDAGASGAATAASAGILAPYIEGHSDGLLQLGICGLAAFDAFVERVSADADVPVEFRRCGTLHIAHTDAESETHAAIAARLRASGVPHDELDCTAALALEPALAPAIVSALHIPVHGYVNVDGLMAALTVAGARHGVTKVTAAVERVDADGRLQRDDGEQTQVDAVVVAAGSWSRQIGVPTSPAVPVKPIRGQRLRLACGSAPVSRIVWGTDCYLVPWIDGHVLVGATVEDVGYDDRATAGGVRALLAGASELVPSLAHAQFDGVRVGFRPFIEGELPVVGRSSRMRRVFYATGHYRNGVLLAPLTATVVADLLLDGRERAEFAALSPQRYGL